MKVVTDLKNIPHIEGPISLTIGVYDGVHLGHQMLFKEMLKQTKKGGSRVILTFSDHPSTFFRPNAPTHLIITLEHRLRLFESFGFDLAIVLPFNEKIANLPYNFFIEDLHKKLPFNHLILGSDARFGKNREGDPEAIKALGEMLHFTPYYLPKEIYQKQPISSGRIRQLLAEGALKKVKKMLGRPYSIEVPFTPPTRENEVQYRLDFTLEDLSILPSAVYAVDIGKVPAIAFYRANKDLYGHTKISLTLYFEQKIEKQSFFSLNFISYLHDELDPELREPITILENLKPQFNLS